MARPVSPVEVTAAERDELRARARSPSTAPRDALRARIVLLRSQGLSQVEVGRELGVSAATVNKWSQRFERLGLEGLADRPGRGAKPRIPPSAVKRALALAREGGGGQRRPSVRAAAAAAGISASSVARIWREHGVPARRANAPVAWDFAGLYLDPPVRALALCRAPPPSGATPPEALPDPVGLLGAIALLDAQLAATAGDAQAHVGWLRFLRQVDRETGQLAVHVLADDGAAQAHAEVSSWLARRPRFALQLQAPTAPGSWLLTVERFLAGIAGESAATSLASLSALQGDLRERLAQRAAQRRPYRWTAGGGRGQRPRII